MAGPCANNKQIMKNNSKMTIASNLSDKVYVFNRLSKIIHHLSKAIANTRTTKSHNFHNSRQGKSESRGWISINFSELEQIRPRCLDLPCHEQPTTPPPLSSDIHTERIPVALSRTSLQFSTSPMVEKRE